LRSKDFPASEQSTCVLCVRIRKAESYFGSNQNR
jgi:hypothetical protein